MATGIEAALVGAAGHFLKKPFEDFYNSCASGVKVFAKSWIAAGAIDKLEQKIEDLEKIRTIVSRQASTLSEIYYPANVIYKKQAHPVTSASSISLDRNILITGTAGQGKSVLMRYMAIEELREGRRFPLFIQLRRIDKSNALEDLLRSQLSLHSEESQNNFLDNLLARGNVVLFLDGFDEIPREFALDVRDKLAELANKYRKVQIVISSRPGALCSHIQDLPRITQVEIAELNEADFEPFLKKIGTEEAVLQRLLIAINSSSTQVRQLLKTPLMLTLLVLTCGGKQKIPDTLPEFYDSLFRVLAVMHDETKPGYVRQMATSLSYSELEQVFECFSFVSREQFDKTSLSPVQFEESLKIAAAYTEKQCTAEGFKADVTETVCLMVREGLDTTFIHKSIQEYYTARFIKALPDDEAAKQAYESINESRFISWTSELRFLEQIDPVRYRVFFRKKQIELFLEKCKNTKTSRKPITKTALKDCLRHFEIVALQKGFGLAYGGRSLTDVKSLLLIEVARDISKLIGKQSKHHLTYNQDLFNFSQQDETLLGEVETIFANKIKEAYAELEEIAEIETRRKSAILNILSRKPNPK